MIYGTEQGVFRSIITAGWGVQSRGEVEAVTGHFSVVEIPAHDGERAEMREAVFSDDPTEAEAFDKVETGWYFVVESSDGSINPDKCKNRDYAFARFALASSAYEAWADGE